MLSRDAIKAKLSRVLNGIEKEFIVTTEEAYNNGNLPYDSLIDILTELGCTRIGDYDTNGWQVDFWETVKYNKEKYSISGSLYYGNFSFNKQ